MGLDELRLTEDEFKELTRKFTEYIGDEEEPFDIPNDLLESVYNSTRGHPHLVRRTLEYLQRQYLRGDRDDDLRRSIVSYDYFLEIQRTRVFDWMTKWQPTPFDTQFLKTAYDTLDDDSTFVVDTKTAEMQEALRRLTRSGLVTYSGRSRLQFAAPIVRIIMGQRLYTAPLDLETSNGSFEAFLQTSIERMRPSELRKSLSHGTNLRLIERAWQKAWMLAASTAIPGGHTISPDVGKVFGSSGFLDFYINGWLKWGVELMREGRRMGDHVSRFMPTGRYKQIPLSEWAIIDFRHNSLRPDFKTLNPNIWYALYADDYSTMTIIRYGKEEMLLTLRGDDPHLSPH
ncbi:7276_t:CDS:1 [Ambispora leptoticha]|uniref:7276_t:CDS:1 n=1 Tax=Ambispora leptoticha TaxID=144679 RepID=A0A9N9IWG9_9GLOM|nr:7276_t:CDS:1 [Ambispora leptoticha]